MRENGKESIIQARDFLGGKKMRRQRTRMFSAFFTLVLFLILQVHGAGADRAVQERSKDYIGAMRVVWCKEWVSLRDEPKKNCKQAC